MTYNGLELESYASQFAFDSPVSGAVCSVQHCRAGCSLSMDGGARIDGYAFCAEHAQQVRAYVEPVVDVPATYDAEPSSIESYAPHIDKPFAYHKPSEDGFERINKLRVAFSDVKARIEQLCPESRHRSVALTELETAAMWAIKAVVFNDPNSEVEGQS